MILLPKGLKGQEGREWEAGFCSGVLQTSERVVREAERPSFGAYKASATVGIRFHLSLRYRTPITFTVLWNHDCPKLSPGIRSECWVIPWVGKANQEGNWLAEISVNLEDLRVNNGCPDIS